MLGAACIGALLFLTGSAVSLAEGGASPDPNKLGVDPASALTQSDPPSLLGMMGQVLLYLILIIGFFFFIMKILAQKNRKRMSGRAINTLGGVPLGQNKSLQIVEIGRSIYILGVGDNVQLVHKIDDPEEAAYLIATITAQSEAQAGMKQLSAWLTRFRRQPEGPVETYSAETELAQSFQEVFHSKMSSMASRRQMVEQLLHESKKTDRSSEE
ncbi:flagellar biosynthetic protein FliO [Paenibacillus sp. HJGM_3]|uniref:flagellar biosynthetic protein FliO n=1 Tax=Paenibacillus sp. HJGM_3 TaxID=3379816 RepID=UPI00385C16E0